MSKESQEAGLPDSTPPDLWELFTVCADFYWQEDVAGRCIYLRCHRSDQHSEQLRGALLGHTLTEAGLLPPEDTAKTKSHKQARQHRDAFHNIVFAMPLANHTVYLSISAAPRIVDGQFLGYHCVASDVTEQHENAANLQRFRAAIDLSMDMIYLVDRETLRFLDVNQRACEFADLSREEMLRLGPIDVLGIPEDELVARYDDLINNGGNSRIERQVKTDEPTPTHIEVHSRAALIGGQWVIIGISRNITHRKAVELEANRLQQMLSALSETNEAILKAPSVNELYQNVCDAAIKGGRFRFASILQLHAPDNSLHASALAGADPSPPGVIRISVDANEAEGQGIAGLAWRSQKPVINNDYQNDTRVLPWIETLRARGINSAAAFPLFQRQRRVALLLFYSQELNAFDVDVEELLVSMADNVSYALESFATDEERKLAEQMTRESEARFRSLTNLTSDFYWEQDAELRLRKYEGPAKGETNKRAIASLLGKHLWDMPPITPESTSWERFRGLLAKQATFRDFEFAFRNDKGGLYYFSLSGEPVFSDSGEFRGYRGISRDITDKKRITKRIEYLATHDHLTALPNRVMFTEMLDQAVKTATRYPDQQFAILFIDLDRFKTVNDTYGHHVGDDLLKMVADRLREPLRDSDILARLGGDEFVVFLQRITTEQQAQRIADGILQIFNTPLQLHGHECDISASIGISLYGESAPDGPTLMKQADAAMYAAKEQGRNNAQFYALELHQRTQERVELELHLRRAVDNAELSVHYQAKLDLKLNRISGVEALLRWNSPELGQVSPARFIPIAEETGMILRIGEWVMRQACQQMMAWEKQGLNGIALAVNLSARQFNDPDLTSKIQQILKDTGFPADRLELEVTESTIIQNPKRAIAQMEEVKRMGIRFAMDDFGTGYSSLGQLKDYPLDTLKIDRSFIGELSSNQEDQAISKAIITMGKTLQLTVVAEGVEQQEQLDFLRSQDCDLIQGFLFHTPCDADMLLNFYQNHYKERA